MTAIILLTVLALGRLMLQRNHGSENTRSAVNCTFPPRPEGTSGGQGAPLLLDSCIFLSLLRPKRLAFLRRGLVAIIVQKERPDLPPDRHINATKENGLEEAVQIEGVGGGEYKTGQLKEPQIPRKGCCGSFGEPRFRPQQFAHVYKGKVLERHSQTGYKLAHFNVKAPPGWHSEINTLFSRHGLILGVSILKSPQGPTWDPQTLQLSFQ